MTTPERQLILHMRPAEGESLIQIQSFAGAKGFGESLMKAFEGPHGKATVRDCKIAGLEGKDVAFANGRRASYVEDGKRTYLFELEEPTEATTKAFEALLGTVEVLE